MVKVDTEQAAQWINRRWKCVNQSDEEEDDTRLEEILPVATTSHWASGQTWVGPRSTVGRQTERWST